MEMLSVDEIRRLASEEGYSESAVGNETILFVRERGGAASSSSSASSAACRVIDVPVFVEVYTGTGDASTMLPHPRQKAWRLFHFGALYSADLFRNVLQHPFSDSNFAYFLSEMKTLQPPSPPTCSLAQALEKQIALIDREINDLQREQLELYKKLTADPAAAAGTTLTRMQLAPAAAAGATGENLFKAMAAQPIVVEQRGGRTPAPVAPPPVLAVAGSDEVRMASVTSDVLVSRTNGDRARGNKGVWSMFYPDAQEAFARAWTAKSANSVALGRGFVISYDDGTATWSDISPLLESKLKQQGVSNPSTTNGPALTSKLSGTASAIGGIASPTAPVRIRYLVLGDEGNFYVKFDNGRMEWCGQDSFGAALRRGVSERRLLVDKVAFAQEGGWLIIWSDRTFEAENIPETLEQRLGGTRTDEDRIVGTANGIKDVTLGPAGEWFIIYKDHSVQADNLPDGLYKCLSQIREKSGRVRTIAFGENRSWFVRYWDGNR